MNATDPIPDISTALERLRSVSLEMTSQLADRAAKAQEAQQAHARAARAGDLGPDWRTIQARIDMGQTSLTDVFTGVDTSAAAQALRAAAHQNLRGIRTAWTEQDDADEKDESPSPAAQVSAMSAESQAHLNALAQQIAAVLARR
jgi:hypothetical protein